MSTILMDGVTDVFKSQVLGSFAANSGESEASVVRGFQAGIGAMVTGLASKVGQSGFSKQVFDLINNPANDTRVLENARGLVGEQPKDGIGSRFMSMLFGGKLATVTDMIGSVSGVRGGTAASLMSLGAPLLLASLGKSVHEGRMDNSRLSSFLAQEASDLRGTLPPGIGTLLNSNTVSAVPPVASSIIRERSNSWMWFALATIAAVLGLVWWFRPSTPNLASIPNVVSNAATTVTDLATRTLPGNINLHIPVGRMEDHLLTWIQDPAKSVDQTTWFDFDRLLFATNSATLDPSSDEQLRNIASILTAYPNVHAKIGGYTDNTGDASANVKLSQQRADTVKQQLMSMGISADRLEAQGYGDQHPVADNATAEGRQLNRRISLRLTQK